MQKITLEFLEENLDDVLEKTENGESFLIMTPDGQDVALVPTRDSIKAAADAGMAIALDDDYFRTMKDHDDAC